MVTGAERRARRVIANAKSTTVLRHRRACHSRPRHWHAAVATLVASQSEDGAWLDALPEALRVSGAAAALQAIVDLDLDEFVRIENPRGFKRD